MAAVRRHGRLAGLRGPAHDPVELRPRPGRAESRPEASRLVSRRAPAYQPFTSGAAPIVLSARARRVPVWREEGRMAGPGPRQPGRGRGTDRGGRTRPHGLRPVEDIVLPRR
ncbi:MAG: hypothetical protein M0C28_26970 [Candidatus Moduliflexus flocculans]|nr:hypothetical protein [Candidatus Moduliflexus flocculans]